MYSQKYPRLVNLLPDCRKSVFLKSLKWFQNQLKRVPGYSTYTIVNPWFRVWGWDYDRGENKRHVFVPEDKTLIWAVIIRAPCSLLASLPAHVCCAALHSVTQVCPTLCDPLGCSPPGSSVHGVLQARLLKWPCPPPGDLPDPGIKPAFLTSPALAGGFFTTSSSPSAHRFPHIKYIIAFEGNPWTKVSLLSLHIWVSLVFVPQLCLHQK